MQIAGKSSGRNARRACASCALLTVAALTGRASGQTWVGNTQDWNTASNWSPAVVPNSTSAAAVFPSFGSGLSTVNISASVSAQSLSFTNTSGQYLISGGANQTLSGVTTINVSAGGTGAVGIGLTSVATGNLLFPSGGNLTINNNNANSGSFLVFGSGSVIGTPGTGGVVFNGAGLTSFIGSFAALGSPNNMVVGGITANGPGEVVLGGDGTNLGGSLTLNGGLMQLDYVPTTATKIASSNPLNLNGGTLQFFTGNGVITQNFSTTNVGAGDTDVQGIINTGGTGNVTFGAGAINHSVAGTVDFQPQSGVLAITTSTGNTGGLLGTGPAFATVNGGANWAMALGGNVTAVTTYGTDNYASGVNTDVTTSTTKFSGITTNSLRFNTNAPTVLTLTGNNTIQSGGILVTPNFTDANGAQITGGSINATANGELLFHVYGSALEIFSNLVSTAGLTKTGPGLLLLEASSPGLTGPININRGSLEVLVNTSAVNSASQINFNDNRLNSVQQMTVDLGFGASGTISRPIRVAAPGGLSGPEDFGTLFTTGNSVNSTVTLSGAISSPAGLNTPICFQALDGSSQFNLTNSGNSFSGNVILKQGSLGISSNGTLGAGGNTLYLDTLGNGGLVFLNSGVTLTHAMTINTETPIVCNGTDSNTISGAITSFLNSGIDKQGTGTLTLTGSTTASLGNFNVDGGTLALTGAAVGVASGVNVFVQTGGTFNAGSAQSQHYGFIDLLGGTFTATSAGPGFIFVNQILDTAGGSINLGNAGSLVLALQGSGAGISVSGNSTWVSPGNSATIGNLTGTPAPISIKPGVTLTNGIALSGVSGFTVTGGGTLFQNSDATNVLNMTAPITVGAASTFRVADASSHSGLGNFGTGAFTLDGGTFEFSGAPVTTSKSIAITANNGSIQVDLGTILADSGTISGPGALTKTGGGTLVLATGNSFASLTVNAGVLATANDNTLGPGNTVTVNAAGNFTFTASTATARTFNLNAGILTASSGATVTLNGSVNGGFMRGPGTFVLADGASLNGVTTFNTTSITQSGTSTANNFTNGGTVNANGLLTINGGTNTTSGVVNANNNLNVADLSSDGVIDVPNGGTLTNFNSSLFLGGGARMNVGTQAAPGGTVSLTFTTLEVNGALLTNFGTITGTTDVNFGGQAQGIGTYGLVNITTGGLFQPGAGSNPPQLNFASVSGIAGNGTIDNATAGGFMDLFVTGPSTSTFAGTIQNTIGLLQLFLRNNASLTLLTSSQPAGGQSVNTYNGGSVISSGCTLTIGAVGALPTGGSVSNNGAFIINADSTCGQLGAGGTTTINTGATLHISPSVGINSQLHIIFNGTGKLDLTNNELLTNQTPAGIRALLSSGVIFSSSAGANTALGYADQGGGVVEVKYTLRGDANLDGKVDVGDLGALATAYGSSSGASWVQGDFNYDGAVNVGDLGALATNYGLSLAGGTAAAAADPSVLPLARISAQAVISPVPEPAGLALIGMAVVGALKRRSRKV